MHLQRDATAKRGLRGPKMHCREGTAFPGHAGVGRTVLQHHGRYWCFISEGHREAGGVLLERRAQ